MSEYIHKLVQNLIKKYDTANPLELIRQLGIQLIYMEDTTSLLGVYTVILRQRTIIIRQNLGKLKRVILAHELGHDMLHRNLYKANTINFFDNEAYCPYDKTEMQANIFAAHLLIDDDDFVNLLREGMPTTYMAEHFNLPIEFVQLKFYELNKLGIIDIKDEFLSKPKGDFLSKRYG